jgi:TolA-binding protein
MFFADGSSAPRPIGVAPEPPPKPAGSTSPTGSPADPPPPPAPLSSTSSATPPPPLPPGTGSGTGGSSSSTAPAPPSSGTASGASTSATTDVERIATLEDELTSLQSEKDQITQDYQDKRTQLEQELQELEDQLNAATGTKPLKTRVSGEVFNLFDEVDKERNGKPKTLETKYTEEQLAEFDKARTRAIEERLGIVTSGNYSMERVVSMLKSIGLSKAQEELLSKIMRAAEKFNTSVNYDFRNPYLAKRNANGIYNLAATSVIVNLYPSDSENRLYLDSFPLLLESGNDPTLLEFKKRAFDYILEADLERIAHTTIHELVHATTHYLIYLYETPKFELVNGQVRNVNRDLLTKDQIKALNGLDKLLGNLKKDPEFADEYGITDISELLAELSNDEFVQKLKNKRLNANESLYARIIRYIAELLGVSAYEEAVYLLDELLRDPSLVTLKEASRSARAVFMSNPSTTKLLERKKDPLYKYFDEKGNRIIAPADSWNPYPTSQVVGGIEYVIQAGPYSDNVFNKDSPFYWAKPWEKEGVRYDIKYDPVAEFYNILWDLDQEARNLFAQYEERKGGIKHFRNLQYTLFVQRHFPRKLKHRSKILRELYDRHEEVRKI